MLTGRTIKILIVDDDEDDFEIISEYITAIPGNTFVIDWASNYNEGLKKIRAKGYDIHFVDYRLGNHTGLDLLKEVCDDGCDEPIVLLTGKGNRAIDIQAMQYGAMDYLIKSELNTEKIERCIRYSLDRLASLQELKSRETKYRNLFEGSKDAVFIADLDMKFLEVNHAASMLFECSIAELLSRSLFDFIGGGSETRMIKDYLGESLPINDLEIRLQNKEKNGEVRTCLLSIVIQKSEDQEPLVHGIIHDITNIKKAEALNLQAQKLAANERLVRMLAHEIRNPLNNISLSIENLQMDPGSAQPQLLDIIQRNSVRINQIISELLNLTKPLDLVFERCVLQEIVDESLELSKDRLNLQQISLEKNYPSQPLHVNADKSKLTIAFTNIIINAIEAMESRAGKLSVTISTSGNSYNISIKDNGQGIPEEYVTKLFEPLFTLKKNGMGLGLATTYSIIQSHKGTVSVDSKVGEGSEFTVNLRSIN